MPMTGDAFGGNTGLMLLLNPETGERKWVSQAEYDSDQRWIADEDAFLTERAGFGLTWRDPTSQEEADKWDYATRTHAEELSRRQREMKRRAAFKPATLFETPDGDMPVLNENVPAFLKAEREKGYEPKQVKGYRSKGFIDANGQKHDTPRFFAGTDDDPALKKILMFQHENKLNGYLTPNMMHFMGYDTQESFEKEEAANARRNERMVENEKRMNFRGMNMPMETSEVFGNAVGFGGQSLSATNKGKGTASQINNFQAAHLNPVASTIDEWGEAVEMRLGSDEGLEELKRREAEGEPLLGFWEKARLGLWGDAMEGVGAEGVHAYMRERQANRRGAEFKEAARGTTFGADVLRATTDSARMGIEHALYNSLLPGFKEGASVAAKWGSGAAGTAIAMGLHGDAKRQKLMADQFQYDPTTGSIKVSQKGAGAIEAALKGYGSAALEYVGEMFSNELLWKPLAKGGKALYGKVAPSKLKKFTDSIAEKYAGSKFVKFLDQVSANPTMEAVRRLNKTTGLNLSIEGLISETIGEELPANVISAGLGLEAPGAGGWEEALDAGIETFKNVPAMAVSVLLMGAGQGVAVRSSQGLYNYATDRATMEKALEALGHKREDLKGKKKMELNDLFFAEMAKRGDNLWEEEKIDKMSESELDEYLKAYNVLPDGDNGQNIPIDQKRSTFKNFLRENGANVFANAAIAKINRATVRSILNGWNYGNVTDRLNTDLFVKHRDIDPDSRDKMRKIMTLRSMANTGTYRGNLAGYMLDAFANSLEGQLSAKDQATLKQFENQYAKSSVAFPGTAESKGVTYEASTFKHPVAQSDWNNNPDGGYVDFGTGIAIRPHQDENGNAAGYRVDVNGAKMTVGQAGSDVDRQLSLLGINPQIGLPYGVQTTTFKTLPEARQFADNLSAWQNTEKKRLLEKAQVAQLIYDRTRPDAPGGLVLLRRPEDAPDAIRDEMVDGLRASPNRSGASLFTRFGAAQGFTSVRDGKVYLFLDNISSPYTMLNTVQHEGLHQGLIDTFRGDSKKRIAFLNELMKDPELPTFIKDELAKANNNVRVFEDILAAVAESVNNGPGLFNAVSKAMRKASARIDGIPMEEGDIHSLIFDAYKAQRIDAEQIPYNHTPTSGSYGQMMDEQRAVEQVDEETVEEETPEEVVREVVPEEPTVATEAKTVIEKRTSAPPPEPKPEPKHGDDRRGHMANANDFFDEDEPAVLELGDNSIPDGTFKWEHLADLNGIEDITTTEAQKRIYDKVDYAEALRAKIKNEIRTSGGETSQSEQWRDELLTFAEIINELPDSEQKRSALRRLGVQPQPTQSNAPKPTTPTPEPKVEKKPEPTPEPKATPAPKQEVPKADTKLRVHIYTPSQKEYRKKKNDIGNDKLLLIREHDFYVAMFDDAKRIEDLLNLRGYESNGFERVGIPYHSIDSYIQKLNDAGHTVVVGEGSIHEGYTYREHKVSKETPNPTPTPEPKSEGKKPNGGMRVVDMINDSAETEEVPIEDIAVNKRIQQFKKGADPRTGVVPGQRIEGEWAKTVARPIRVMEFKDGHREVITGRHRLDLARRNGMKTISAYVYREADGMTIEKARQLDALENILDDKGRTKDYVRFFSDTTISEEDLKRLGISNSDKATVRDAYAIGKNAIDEVRVHAMSDDTKVPMRVLGMIARHDKRVQLALLDTALKRGITDHTMIDVMGNQLEWSMEGRVEETGEQDDLFGSDDAAIEESRAIGLGAAEMIREMKRDRDVVSAVARREKNVTLKDEAAARLGIKDKTDKAELQRAYNELSERIAEIESPTIGGELRAEALRRGQEIIKKEKAKGVQEEMNFNAPAPAPKKAEPKPEPKAEAHKETPKPTPAPKPEAPKVNKDGTKVRDPIDKAASAIASNFYRGFSGMKPVYLGNDKHEVHLSHQYGNIGSVIKVWCSDKETETLARKAIADSAKNGKNPFYSDKKNATDYGTTFHILSRKDSVKALLDTFGFHPEQKARFGAEAETVASEPKPEPKVETPKEAPKPAPAPKQEAPKAEPKKELPQVIVSSGLAPENAKPAPKAEASKVELTEAGTRKDVAGLVDEIADLLDVGLFREGVPNNEERDFKVNIAVSKLINIHLDDGGRTFKGFAKFYRASTDRIKGLWEASKRFLPPRWTLAVIENPTLGLDELTPSQAMAILAEVENDTINNNKETNNERPVNSSRNDSPNSGLGNQSGGSGKVQSNRGGGTGRSSGNNSSGMGKSGVRNNEPHENVVPDQSSSDNKTDGSRSGGRDNPADRSGGQSQRQETSVSNMGSSASNGDVPVNPSEGSTSSANKRGRGSQTVFDKEAQKSRDSLLKGVAVDYVIPKNGGKIGKLGGAKSRYAANIEALKILNAIQEEGRYATPEEQEKLALYSGWGGLSSVFNEGNSDWDSKREELRNLLSKEDFELARRSVQYAHFTPISVVQTMYKALEKMGVKGEGVTFFEAGTGVGNFIGSRPEAMRGAPYMGIEVDPVSSRIVKALYPNANVVQAGFQNIILPENSVDVVVGNPPYSDLRLYDKHFPESKGMSIHNHFIAKQIRALRPGGVGTFIVSRYFMDGKDARTREYILSQADLVSAIRLPNGIFGEIAGTDVVTDILVFRKRLPGEPKPLRTDPNGVWVDTRLYTNPKREENEVAQSVTMNRYFINNPQNVLGKFSAVTDSRYKSNTLEVANSKIEDTESVDKFAAKEIWNALERTVPDNVFAPDKRLSPQYNNQMDRAEELQSGEGTTDGASHPALMTGGHFIGDDGSLYWSTKDSMGIVRHIKVQPYDDKAEKAAYLREEERRKASNPRYKSKPFDRFLHVRNTSAKLTPKEQEFVKAFVHLRNVRYDLIALERSSESTDEQLDAKRKELNEAYEACKPRLIALEKPQGEFSLNTKRVRMLLGEDPAMACVTGLEEYDLRKKENPDGTVSKSARFQFVNVRKAAIFSHRVYHPEAEMKSRYSNATDAYLASINKFGRLDMAWMSEVLGVGEIELENILSENGLAFFDPDALTWASKEAYLSGDVKTKLAQAERALEDGDKRMEKNVERLKEVQPADIPVENITISFGSPIIKPSDVGAFARERLGFDRDDDVKVEYDEKSGKWHVANADNITDKTHETFPCPELSFKRMLDAALNNKTVKIKKEVTVQTRLGPVVKEVVDEASSAVCNATISSVRNLWDSWWRQSPVRGRKYVERYNERFNRYVQPKFDGSILSLEGLDKSYTPYKHQRDAAMRMIQTGNVLFNHVVGSGKTLTTIISIMEMRRMGLVRKPCIVVPNSLTQQWRKDFLRAYPGANVLAPQDSEFKANERKRLMARIQSGDWDVVIVPQSQFGMLDLQPSVKRRFIEDEIANLRQASANLRGKAAVFGVEKRIQALEIAIEKAEDAMKRDETGIFFDTLGIDGLFVDEAQDFKNVPYVSSKQVTGMGNTAGSGKALDLLMKVQWMRKYMPGAPIGFLTGTPVSNSLVELYLNMRYMAPELLERMGLHTMDAFLEQFVNISSEFEITSSGSYKERMSVRNMKNVGTFMQGILSYMDVIDLDDLRQSMLAVGKEFDVPELEGGAPINVVAKRSPEQQRYFGVPITRVQDSKTGKCSTEYPRGSILGRSEALQAGMVVDKSEDNLLWVYTDSIRASLDMRLVNQDNPDFKGSKVNLCVDNVIENYRKYSDWKGTQIIFCDKGVPNSGKAALKKDLRESEKKLEKEETTLRKLKSEGKTEEEIAVTVDDNGESVIERIDKIKNEIVQIKSELSSTFSVYEDVKKKFIAAGIPADEIAFIHDYDTTSQKLKLFERMNEGKVRILIGSTGKMGTGVNVQERIVALHHLDVPTRPADLVQRNGRAIRQGNTLKKAIPGFTMRVYQYATERTGDSFSWQMQERKARSMSAIYKATPAMGIVDDVSEAVMSAEEMKAAATGSKIYPRAAEVRKEVKALEDARIAQIHKRSGLEDTVSSASARIDEYEKLLDKLERAQKQIKPLERPEGNMYYGVEVVSPTGTIRAFEPRKTLTARKEAEGDAYESIAFQLKTSRGTLNYRGLVWKFKEDVYKVHAFESIEKSKDFDNSLFSVDIFDNDTLPGASDGILLGNINKRVNAVNVSIETAKKTVAEEQEVLESSKNELATMPETFEPTEEQKQLQVEAQDLDYVMQNNCLTGSEADYALKIKYRNEGKTMPNYEWADPYDYGESDAPTQLDPPIDSANAGLFREDPSLLDEERALRRAAMPKGQLAKAQEAVHNALVRNEGETLKAWAKRKVKAVGSFVSSLMVDSRRPVVDAMKEITEREKFHESEDIPLAMQLSYGRVFAGHHEIDTNYVKPVLKKLADNGLNLEDLDIYLTAKFAPERNKMIKERTETATKPGNLEGSGMSDEKAAALLNAMREEMTPVQFNALESAAELVYKMNRENLDRLVEYGIMAEEQAEEWKRLSPHYVPLRDDLSDLGVEFPDQVSMVGQNYVHAVGRFSEAVTSQFAWSILQAKQGIMWAEQNYINNVALNFCHNNKSDEDYVISPMPVMSKKVYKGKRGFRPDDAIALRASVPSEAAALKTLAEAGFTLVPDKKNEGVYWVDTREMEMIPRVRNTVDKLRTAQRHNVIAKVGGKKVYILFNPQKNTRGNRMGRAITRADMWDPKHPLWTVVTQLTRIKSLMTTTLSPTFAINNMRRDLVQTTGIMLAEGRGEALKDVYRNYLPALKAVRDWKKTDKFDDTEVGRYFKEAVENGVLTGTWANSTHTDTMINSVLDPLFDMQNRQKFGKEIGATIGVSYRGLKDFLNTFSEIPEVGMRLAVYSALRKNGMSKNEATVYAREITIDFNKKGQLTPVMNVLYMFSNASIQSVARWNKAIRNPDGTISKRAYLGALSYMLIGFFNKMLIATAASALFGGGDDDEKDDERWKNIPDYAYQRGVPIMLGDYYVDMPVQGIPSAFLYLGSRLYDVLVDPNTSVAEAFVDTAKGPLLENVNFVNGTGSVWQFLTPTFLDPIVQIIENKSWTGAPLHASRYPNDTTPASYSGRKNTSEWAKAVAKGLNAISGGDDIKPGALDFYPETIALIGQFFVSQVGVDAAGIGQLLTGDLKVKNVPILRGLLKEVPDETNRYYAAATDFAEKLSYWKDYNAEGRDSDIAKLERNNSFLLEANRLQNIQNRIRKLVTEKNRLAARGIEAPDVDKSISYYRKLFLDVYSGKTEK